MGREKARNAEPFLREALSARLPASFQIYILFGRWGSGVRGPWYEGNFAPIAGDTDPVEVKVVSGQLPKDLEGCLIRNGPNSLYQPRGGFHWFDGDGMLHALRLKGGRAFYSRQLVETDKVACERKWGRSLFPSFDDFRGLGGLLTLWMAILKTWLRITPTPGACVTVTVATGDPSQPQPLLLPCSRSLVWLSQWRAWPTRPWPTQRNACWP